MIYLPYNSIGEILQTTSSPLTGRESVYTALLPDAIGTLSTTDDSISDETSRVDLSSTPTIVDKIAVAVPSSATTTVNTAVTFTGIPSTVSVNVSSELVPAEGDGSVIAYNDDDAVEITDGTLDFTTDLSGTYTLVFTSPLYLDTTTVITVTE